MYKYLLALSIFFSQSADAQQYIPKADMPVAKRTFVAAAANGKIYVFAGANGSNVLATVHEYDPVTNTWAAKQNIPTALHEGYAGTVNGKIYVIGGYNTGALNLVQEYDPSTNTWASKATMPTARATVSGAVVNNKIYITAGWSGEYKALEVYDPATNTWATQVNCPYGFLQNNGGVSVGDDFYSICGRSNNYQSYYDFNLKFKTQSNDWDTMSPMPASLYGGAAVNYRGKIHYFGGAYKNAPPSVVTGLYHPNVNTHYIYEPALNSWTSGLALPAKRSGHHTIELNDKVYIIGGYDSAGVGGESNKVWEYSEPATATCNAPDDTISNINHNSALIKWNTVPGATGYKYEVSTTATPPATGTHTTNTQYPAGSLTPVTKYYVHLKTMCTGDSSAWATSDFTTLPVSISATTQSSPGISIYPNPAQGNITVKRHDGNSSPAEIIITDLAGSVIRKLAATNTETEINLENLATGVYMLQFADKNSSHIFKITKL